MDIQKTFKSALDIALLKEPVMNQVANDKEALVPALTVFGVSSLIGALGSFLFPMHYGIIAYRPDLASVLSQAVIGFVIGVAFLYLMGFLAEKVFHSKLSMDSFVKVMGYANIVGLFAIMPALSIISGVWGLVILWNILTKLGKLEVGPIILLIAIQIVIVMVLAGGYASMMYL